MKPGFFKIIRLQGLEFVRGMGRLFLYEAKGISGSRVGGGFKGGGGLSPHSLKLPKAPEGSLGTYPP